MKYATMIVCVGGMSLNGAPITNRDVYERFKQYIPKEFEKFVRIESGFTLPLITDSPECNECLDWLKSYGVVPRLFRRPYYTESELEKIPFFRPYPSFPLELEGTTAKDYGTVYQGGCSCCGLGEKPVGDLLIDRKFLKNHKMGVIPDLYVSEETRCVIEENKLTGVSFKGELKDWKGRPLKKKYYSMEIDTILPPMSKNTWLDPIRLCKNCNQTAYYLDSDIQYEKEKLINAKDFNFSMEYVNNYKTREIVMSAAAKQAFTKNKIRLLGYQPIAVI